MKKVLTIIAASAACVFALNSCSQDEEVFNPSFSNVTAGDDIISFRTNVDRVTRGIETTSGNIGETDKMYVTAYYRKAEFNPGNPSSSSDASTYYDTFDEDHGNWYSRSFYSTDFSSEGLERLWPDKIMFWDRAYKKVGNSFEIDGDQPFHWPGSGQYLTFHAYYPSTSNFRENGLLEPEKSTYGCMFDVFYYLDNAGEDYVNHPCLKYVGINPDISKQKDLVVTETPTHQHKGDTNPTATPAELQFNHILSQVVIKAKCDKESVIGKTYNVQVAGIKISNPRNYATYDMITGEWHDCKAGTGTTLDTYMMDNHSYTTYANSYFYKDSEGVITLGENPQSLMGDGNAIFTIPVERIASELKPANDGGGMYIGVLLRITRKDNGKVVFPYADAYTIPYEVIESIKDPNEYVNTKAEKYITYLGPGQKADDSNAERYQWAAIPVKVKWEKGKKYLYTLDFSNGVGFNDPADGPTEDGGIRILDGKIELTETVVGWDTGNFDDQNPGGEEIEFDKYHK